MACHARPRGARLNSIPARADRSHVEERRPGARRMNDPERSLPIPELPPVARRVLELPEGRELDIAALDEALGSDPGLQATLLRVLNHPVWRTQRPVDTVRDGILSLGPEPLRSLALALSYASAWEGGERRPSHLDPIRHTSLMVALAARRLADETGGWEREEAFLCGLLADCGVLRLADELPDYRRLLERFWEGEADLLDLERAVLDTDHVRVGGHALERWGFPEQLRLLIAAHHDASRMPSGSAEELRARVLNASWLCARALCVPGFTAEMTSLGAHVAILLGLPVTLVRAIVAELPDELREAAGLFGLPSPRQKDHDQLLDEANAMLAQAALRAGRDQGELASATGAESELARRELELSADEETGLLSRAGFDRLIDAYHRRARQARTPLGLMIVEIESLKGLSAKHGAAVAAELLRAVGERACERLRETDHASRFAEAQVAVLLPGCALEHLQTAAERVRVAVEERPIETRAGEIQCQVAIGLAGSVPHRDALDPRTLITLASSAVDRAQASADRIALAR